MQWDRGVGGRLRYAPSATFSGVDADLRDGRRRDRHREPPGRRDRDGRGLRAADAPDGGAHRQRPHRHGDEHHRSSPSTGRPVPRCRGVRRSTTTRSTGPAATASTRRASAAGLGAASRACRSRIAYAFRVRAVDVYGEAGPWGPASASKRYDVAPPAVSSATAQFDVTSSTSIDVAWTPPSAHAGSAIRFYDIYIGSRLQTSVPAPQTSARIDGLVTGQPYEFTIKTRNASDEQSDGVTTTPPVRPLAVPTFVPTPVVTESLNVNDSVDVSWPTPSSPSDIPATGGDDPANLRLLRGHRRRNAATGHEPRLLQLLEPDRGSHVSDQARSREQPGREDVHAALSSCARYLGGPVSFTTYGPPSAVTNLAATANAPQQLSLTFTPGTLPAGSPSDLQSKVYLTAVDPAIPGLDLSSPIEITSGFSTPANLSTGQQYDFTVLACAVPSSTPTRRFCESTLAVDVGNAVRPSRRAFATEWCRQRAHDHMDLDATGRRLRRLRDRVVFGLGDRPSRRELTRRTACSSRVNANRPIVARVPRPTAGSPCRRSHPRPNNAWARPAPSGYVADASTDRRRLRRSRSTSAAFVSTADRYCANR